MCGIFGIVGFDTTRLTPGDLQSGLARLFTLSERRGREAAGLMLHTGQALALFKRPCAARRMIRTREYRDFLARHLADIGRTGAHLAGPFAAVGHARLVTNGRFGLAANNQPVRSASTAVVHNGIVVNDRALWARHPTLTRNADVDSAVIPALLEHALAGGAPVDEAVRALYRAIEGEANIAAVLGARDAVVLATNTGSLYLLAGHGLVVFASERPFLERFLAMEPAFRALFTPGDIQPLGAGEALSVDLCGGGPASFALDGPPGAPAVVQARQLRVIDTDDALAARRTALRRCTRCVLPETIPGIRFDAEGVCHYCRRYQPVTLRGLAGLREEIAAFPRRADRADCVIGLSGGRDSCYGLHVLVRELGLRPLAYTYDWALVTDLARRNQSRMCAKLGVEHVLVSADIQQKRRHIRANIHAWLRRPDLGMIPLFMAGDKMYFHHYYEIARDNGIDLIVTCGNRYEATDFKAGFAGVRSGPVSGSFRPYDVSWRKKLRLLAHYGKNFALNPAYVNASLLDTARGFQASYLLKHRFVRVFDHVEWDEAVIDDTLKREYAWETAGDTDSTWRVGDGTAAFYNYIYYTVAGFSEHDTFRSNQVRAGRLARDEALRLVTRDNQPRYESIEAYANLIGFELDHALTVIDGIPKLY